jgi:uncharacterized protein YcfJ
MEYIKKFSKYSASVGLGALLATGITGCGGDSNTQQTQQQPEQKNAFVVLEEVKPGKYKVAEEFPAKETRIILKKLDGNETVLTKEELDKLVKEEAAKIENGTSNLTKPEGAQVAQQNGMSVGEAILASAAGAVIGSWIGNKLFNNPNYQQTRRATYKSPAVYNKSVSSFKNASPLRRTTTPTTKRSGFFGSKSTSSRGSFSSSRFGG